MSDQENEATRSTEPDAVVDEEVGAGLFKGVAKHSLIYGLGMLVSRAVSIVMLPIYLNYLTPADYGVLFLVEMTLDFIAIVGGGQLALGIFRFYHKTDDLADKYEMVSTSFALVGLMYAVVGTLTFLSAGIIADLLFGGPEHIIVVRIASVNLAAGAMVIVPLSLARVEDLSRLYVTVNVGKLLLAVAMNIFFIVILGMGVLGIFLSSLLTNILVGTILSIWLVRRVGRRVSRTWTRQLLRYGIPLMGMQVATFVTTFSDRYFLQAASDEDLVGLYGLAYQFGFLLIYVGVTPINMVWGPKRFEVARGGHRDVLLSRGFLMQNIVLFTTAVGICLFVADVLRVIAKPEFHSAAAVVPVILIAYVFQTWADLQDIGILVVERTKFLTLANVIGATVAVVGYATLIPRYLEWGAATATVMAFATRYAFTYAFAQRFWPVRYRWRPILILAAWSVGVVLFSLNLPAMQVVLSLTTRVLLVLVFGAGLWLLPILATDEREMVRRGIRLVIRTLREKRRRGA